MPEEEIVPFVGLPPGTLLTDHVTRVFVVPVTVALNCWELPARTFAGFGVTETWTCAGEGCCGAVPEPEPLTLAHPAWSNASRKRSVRNRRFKEVFSW
jgi:hypothetical protein